MCMCKFLLSVDYMVNWYCKTYFLGGGGTTTQLSHQSLLSQPFL